MRYYIYIGSTATEVRNVYYRPDGQSRAWTYGPYFITPEVALCEDDRFEVKL